MNMNANFAQGEINQGINPSIIISSPNVVCECGNKLEFNKNKAICKYCNKKYFMKRNGSEVFVQEEM